MLPSGTKIRTPAYDPRTWLAMFADNIYHLPKIRLCQAPANKDLRVRRRAPVPVSLRLGSEPCDIRRMCIWMLVLVLKLMHDVQLQLLQPVAKSMASLASRSLCLYSERYDISWFCKMQCHFFLSGMYPMINSRNCTCQRNFRDQSLPVRMIGSMQSMLAGMHELQMNLGVLHYKSGWLSADILLVRPID